MSTDEIVERVAMAMAQEIGWGTFSHFDPNDMRRLARAAIVETLRAVRAPTREQKDAGFGAMLQTDFTGPQETICWQAMIDHLLSTLTEQETPK